jgi:hypothetical protein
MGIHYHMLKRNLSHAKELEKDVLNQALITSARDLQIIFPSVCMKNRVIERRITSSGSLYQSNM